MIENIGALINAAVTEVFGTMLNMQMVELPAAECVFTGQAQIASAVGFTGQLTGVVYLYTTTRFAGRITQGLIGLEPTELATEEMVNDAMGEIANMVVGHFKSRLVDRGVPCVMTIPSIVRGSQFGIEAVSHTEVQRLGFQANGNFLLVELLLRGGNGFR
jgi:chemotaxis protein CheX